VKPVIITADDYAMDAGVDAAVLALGRQGAISAASAMVLSPSWPEAGRRLADCGIDRGLHLDFTSAFATPLSGSRSLARLIGAAFLRRLDRNDLRNRIERQLDAFEAAMKTRPDFVDGHQHVHQLPQVREALLGALKARYGALTSQIGLRLCLARRWRGIKAAVVAATGARSFARLVRGSAHPANTDFAGVYGFAPEIDLAALWRNWLAGLGGGRPLIMCHVALAEAPSARADPIRAARIHEWQWLGSTAFRDLCAELRMKPHSWGSAGNANAE
jgi:chitin disaccharide deacetylase